MVTVSYQVYYIYTQKFTLPTECSCMPSACTLYMYMYSMHQKALPINVLFNGAPIPVQPLFKPHSRPVQLPFKPCLLSFSPSEAQVESQEYYVEARKYAKSILRAQTYERRCALRVFDSTCSKLRSKRGRCRTCSIASSDPILWHWSPSLQASLSLF